MKITIFGCGYVGLVTGACLAEVGHEVVCFDIDAPKVKLLCDGVIPIYENGLSAMVQRNLANGNIAFTADAPKAVNHGKLLFVAVGTPSRADGRACLDAVYQVARTIGQCMNEEKVIIDKSTVPVGTAREVRRLVQGALDERGSQLTFDVCSNPEFLKEGCAIADFTQGARIVIGTDSEKVRKLMKQCYAPYNRNRDKMMFMGVESAELTKYAANAMLATRISFINEVANIAERVGADIQEVRLGIGSDPRIGFDFIYPGCGFGGSCFPKDLQALTHLAKDHDYEPELMEAVQRVNQRQKGVLFAKLTQALQGNLAHRRIAVWGLAFKPETNDMRDAPSLVLIEQLLAAQAQVSVYDPVALPDFQQHYAQSKRVQGCHSLESSLAGADALVICTEWKQFRGVKLDWLKASLKLGIVVDGRNLFDPQEAKQAALRYYSIGREDRLATEGV